MRHDFASLEILNWEPAHRRTVRARFDIRFPCGLTVKKFSLSESFHGRRVNLPSWAHLEDGRRVYQPCIGFDDAETLARFKVAALAALDAFTGGER
jgi:hypothetical protein